MGKLDLSRGIRQLDLHRLLRNGSSGEGFVHQIKCSFKWDAQLLFEAYCDVLNIKEIHGQMVSDSKCLQRSGTNHWLPFVFCFIKYMFAYLNSN
jgi:hypothetical protein